MKWGLGIVLTTMLAANVYAADATMSKAVSVDGSKELIQKPERIYGGSMFVGMTGKRFDDEVVNSAYGRGSIGLTLTGAYQDWLKGKFGAGQVLSSGAASNLYAVTEGTASSYAFLDEADLTLIPYTDPYFETRLTGGVVPIRQNPILSSLWEVNSWAAAKLEVEQRGDDGKIAFTAQQAIPSARDVSNRLFDEDTLPIYTNANLAGTVNVGGLKFGLAAAHFVFTDPSTSAASDSMKIGSTTFGNGKSTSFAYDYRGMEYAGIIGYEAASGDTFAFAISDLSNELSPNGRANLAKLEYKYVGNKWDYLTQFTGFRLESDSVPATYVNPGYGFTNRIGGTIAVKADQRKEKFSLSGAYTRALVLDTDAASARDGYQADRDIFTLAAEFKYDIF